MGNLSTDTSNKPIVMLFVDDTTNEYFTDTYNNQPLKSRYEFDTPEEFFKIWDKIVEHPDGMWYFVFYKGNCICAGACDSMDEEIFVDWFGFTVNQTLDKYFAKAMPKQTVEITRPDCYKLTIPEVDDADTVKQRIEKILANNVVNEVPDAIYYPANNGEPLKIILKKA